MSNPKLPIKDIAKVKSNTTSITEKKLKYSNEVNLNISVENIKELLKDAK